MSRAQRTILRYLEEAQAMEVGLQRDLQAQIAITPAGPYRRDLERHLRQTRDHAERVAHRADDLGRRRDPLRLGVGIAEAAVAQAVSLARAPLALLRGRGGEEKVLKNAKDAAAAEALEIATYEAIEQLAAVAGDTETERLAASIRKDEEWMLGRLREHIPGLTDDVAAHIAGDGTFDIGRTGAAEAAKGAGRAARETAADASERAKRELRGVPGAAQVEGEARGAVATADDLPIARYDDLTADEVAGRLPGLTQIDLGVVDAYERRHADRTTVTGRIDELRGSQPWAGYDEQTATEIRSALADADGDTRRAVRDYERRHKDRQSVLQAAERAPA